MDKTNTTHHASRESYEALQQELEKTRAELADAHAELDSLHADEDSKYPLYLTDTGLEMAFNQAVSLRDRVQSLLNNAELSDSDRRRLLGSGVRRYGFIDKVSDLMAVNTDFIPSFLDPENFKTTLRRLETVRNVNALLQQTLRLNTDILLILGDEAYRQALSFYGAVRDAARRRAPGASELFRIMAAFFHRGRRTDEEPTEPELERDFHALLHGRKDGEIVIKNEKPHLVGGIHEVADETHKPKGAWKATEEGEIR